MFIVELVMQGVRGIRELNRLRFKGGFNFVAAGNESGKTSSVDTMQRLLFPRNEPQLIDPLVSKQTPDASRGALVAYSDDGAYYRVIEDFSKRAINLSKYNAATKEFVLTLKDWGSIAQFMAGLSQGISEEEYDRLYVFRRGHKNAGRSAHAGTPAPAPAAAPAPAPVAGRTAAQEKRLAELRRMLQKAEEAADADYKLQSGRLKLDEIRKQKAGLEDFGKRFDEVDANLESLKACAALPENLAEALEEHERRETQKMADSDELNKQIAGLQAQIDAVPQLNLVTDKLFIAGAVAGGISIIAGLFVLGEEQRHYFPLGLLVSLALMAVAWYQGSQKNNVRKALTKELEGLQADLAALEKSFGQGGASVMAWMKDTGSTTVAELKEKADNYRYFRSMHADLDEQRKRRLGDRTLEGLDAECGRQEQEVLELEKAARALAQDAGDALAIRQEIERLESETGGGGAAENSSSGRELVADFSFAAPPAAEGPAGFLAELGIASRICGIEMETLVPAVEAAAQRNLSAISGGKYVRIEAGHEGDPVVHGQDDTPVHYAELSHGAKDLIYFCLRTGLVEALAGKRRLPFILDDPLAGFDPARQQAACQVLRALGAKTQVILFTSNPALKAAGDSAAELK